MRINKIVGLGLAVVLGFGLVGCVNTEVKEVENITTEETQDVQQTEETKDMNKVLLDNEVVTVTLINIYRTEDEICGNQVGFNVNIKNKSDKPISVWANNTSIENKMVSLGVEGTEIRPQCEVDEAWTFWDNNDEMLDMELDELKNIKFELELNDNETYETISTTEITIND